MITQLSLLPARQLEQKARPSALSDRFLACTRKDSEEFLICVNYVNGTKYKDLRNVPIGPLRATRSFLSPGFYQPAPDPMTAPLLPPSEVKLYKVKPTITKQRSRCTKALNKLKKRLSLFWIDEAQSKLLTNPEYYGICVLPCEKVCSINPGQRLGWAAHERAIERENELRKRGMD